MIAILTDFGASEYVGVMKGVIYSRCPRAVVVDLFHGVEPQNVREGAWVLLTSYRHFPEGTIFLAVVDPGVGTERQGVAVRTGRYFFVGPHNGLLYPAAVDDGVQQVVRLAVPEGASRTFHGRDVFAPAAAALERGSPLGRLGEPAELRVPLAFHREGREGEVVRIDPFGNIVTNLPPAGRAAYRLVADALGEPLELPCYGTYGEAEPDRLFCVVGSAGTLEISVRNGSAAARLPLRTGTRLRLE